MVQNFVISIKIYSLNLSYLLSSIITNSSGENSNDNYNDDDYGNTKW